MPIDRSEAREEALYAGLADNAPHRPRRQPRKRNARLRDLIVGGVTLTLGLGILAGAVALPELSDIWRSAPAPPPAPRAAPTPLARASLQRAPRRSVLPASIPLPPIPAPPAPAETAAPAAAPEVAEAPTARGTQVAVVPTQPDLKPLPETGGRLTLPPEMAGARPVPAAPAVEPAAPARASNVTASFDCAPADAGAAEQLVCSDAELAAADRELARAYGRAMRSGAVAPEDLDLDQRDWAALREDAARYSRQALASVYAQRIRELEEIAAEGPRADEGQ